MSTLIRRFWAHILAALTVLALAGCAQPTSSSGSSQGSSGSGSSQTSSGSVGSSGSSGAGESEDLDADETIAVDGEGTPEALPNTVKEIPVIGGTARVPAMSNRTQWAQTGGSADHSLGHATFTSNPTLAWTYEVSKRMRRGRMATTEPLIVGNRAYVLSWDLSVSALNLGDGSLIWRRSLLPENDRDGTFGGGMALRNGVLYVSTGAARLHALSPTDGSEIWEVRMDGPSRTGPLLHNGLIYVRSISGNLEAFTLNGEETWIHEADTSRSTVLAATKPAGSGNAVFTFEPIGEVKALLSNGETAWTLDLGLQGTSGRLNDVISDSRALPVIDGNFLLASSWADRTAAISTSTGTRLWEFPVGGAATPVVTGSYVFMITKDGFLRAITRSGGEQVWATDLGRESENKRVPSVGWYGPVLAGGNLIVVSSEGVMKLIQPSNGAQVKQMDIGSPAITDMSLANGTLLVTTIDGLIRAYR